MRGYSFVNIGVFINGIQVTDFSDGDAVLKVVEDGKPTSTVGADGRMVVSFPASKSGKITIDLQSTSEHNKYLRALWVRQQAGPQSMVPVQLIARDSYRQDIFEGVNGYISSAPDIERGVAAGKQTWEFTFQKIAIGLGAPSFAGLATAIAESQGGV